MGFGGQFWVLGFRGQFWALEPIFGSGTGNFGLWTQFWAPGANFGSGSRGANFGLWRPLGIWAFGLEANFEPIFGFGKAQILGFGSQFFGHWGEANFANLGFGSLFWALRSNFLALEANFGFWEQNFGLWGDLGFGLPEAPEV